MAYFPPIEGLCLTRSGTDRGLLELPPYWIARESYLTPGVGSSVVNQRVFLIENPALQLTGKGDRVGRRAQVGFEGLKGHGTQFQELLEP